MSALRREAVRFRVCRHRRCARAISLFFNQRVSTVAFPRRDPGVDGRAGASPPPCSTDAFDASLLQLRCTTTWVNTMLVHGVVMRPRVSLRDRMPSGRDAMIDLTSQYLPIAIFLGVALLIGSALMLAPFLVAVRNPDPEKVSAYECGFNAFDDARMKFDVRFYLVSILFIIFDLEIAFLFPWAVAFKSIGVFGFWSMMVFLGVLTIGFIYEWKKGALEWE
jgi:NADH-quinone oxidoreductase subunit A